MFKILLADDEKIIREPVGDYLTAKGFSVTTAENGSEAVTLCEENEFDLVILDIMMPIMDGLEACKKIRKDHNMPILFLSALGEEEDLLDGYKSGCDDYILKPFPLSVLTEKCRLMINKHKNLDSKGHLSVGSVYVDTVSGRAYSGETELRLTAKDFELLSYLLQNKNMVLSRDLILTRVWGYDYDGDARVVDTHIKKLRKALGENAYIIETVFGVGYAVKEDKK